MEVKYFFQLGDYYYGGWKDLNFRIKTSNMDKNYTSGLGSDGRISYIIGSNLNTYPSDSVIFKWKSGDNYD